MHVKTVNIEDIEVGDILDTLGGPRRVVRTYGGSPVTLTHVPVDDPSNRFTETWFRGALIRVRR